MSETADGAGQVSAVVTTFAEKTSTNVHQVAAAAEELATSAREIESRLSTSAGLVRKAVEDIGSSEPTWPQQVMSGIGRAESEEVVKRISDIAAQTATYWH